MDFRHIAKLTTASTLVLLTSGIAEATRAEDAPPAPAAAAVGTGSSDGLPEVVVTAQRRETELQKTPVAITTFSNDQIQQEGIESVRDLSGQIPNLFIPRSGLTPLSDVFSLRGIGESDPTRPPTIATYLDDVYIPRAAGALFDLTEIQQVEVLRGPQGTLYGRNSAAGAFRLTTPEPTDTPHLTLSSGIGNYGDLETHDYLSGPIVNGILDGDLTYVRQYHDGYTWNATTGKRVDNQDTEAARGKLHLRPNDDWVYDLALDGTWDHSTGRNAMPGATATPGLTYDGQQRTNANFDGGGISLKATNAINDQWTLKSITSYRSLAQASPSDADGTATDVQHTLAQYFDNDATQEFQLQADYSRLKFTSGIFLYHENYKVERNIFQAGNYTYVQNGITTTVNYPIGQYSTTKTDSAALYSEANYKLTPDLTAITGLRFTREKQDFNYTLMHDNSAGVPQSAYFNSTDSQTWNSATPKVGLQYQWTPELMQYGTISRGFQGGGFDDRATKPSGAGIPVSPETVTSYELGIKSETADHRARFNADAFYNQFNQLQANVFDPSTSLTVRKNAGEAHTEGFEVETAVVPFSGLTWGNNLSYLFAVYDQFNNPATGIASAAGNRLINAPRWQGMSKLDYIFPIPVPGTLRWHGDVEFQTMSYSDALNTPGVASPWQVFYDTSISYTTEDEHWSADFAVRNLFNREYVQGGAKSGSLWTVYYNPPQTTLFTVRYRI